MFNAIILSFTLLFISLFQNVPPPPIETTNCYGPQAEITHFDPSLILFSIYDQYVVCQVTLYIDEKYVIFPTENENYAVTGIGTHNIEIKKICSQCSSTEFIWVYTKPTIFLYLPIVFNIK